MSTLSNTVYNKLKATATTVLPALATLYFGLSEIWHFPAGQEVVATITAINVFLGVVLHISSKAYNGSDETDGTVTLATTEEGHTSLEFSITPSPADLISKGTLNLKVDDQTTS